MTLKNHRRLWINERKHRHRTQNRRHSSRKQQTKTEGKKNQPKKVRKNAEGKKTSPEASGHKQRPARKTSTTDKQHQTLKDNNIISHRKSQNQTMKDDIKKLRKEAEAVRKSYQDQSEKLGQ